MAPLQAAAVADLMARAMRLCEATIGPPSARALALRAEAEAADARRRHDATLKAANGGGVDNRMVPAAQRISPAKKQRGGGGGGGGGGGAGRHAVRGGTLVPTTAESVANDARLAAAALPQYEPLDHGALVDLCRQRAIRHTGSSTDILRAYLAYFDARQGVHHKTLCPRGGAGNSGAAKRPRDEAPAPPAASAAASASSKDAGRAAAAAAYALHLPADVHAASEAYDEMTDQEVQLLCRKRAIAFSDAAAGKFARARLVNYLAFHDVNRRHDDLLCPHK